jgi:transglutaminase-like putative cysteine protease
VSVDRRALLKSGAAIAATSALPRQAFPQSQRFAPAPGAWRHFQTVTRIALAEPAGSSQAWVPLPAFRSDDWFRPAGSTWTASSGAAEIVRDQKYGAEFLHVTWSESDKAPTIEVTSSFATRDRAVDLTKPGNVPPLSAGERDLYLAATDLIPTTGIVKDYSDRITAGAGTDLDKARRIYDWVVESTYRDAKVRGCGLGDIASMLSGGHFGGKCADLNALFVGLSRAAGLPARDIYGLRVAPSLFGYKSLGAGSTNVTKSQHCRAEVFLNGFGWVPVDPADVRKVMLEEPPGNLGASDGKVVEARRTLFGAWETNWLAYNSAHDVALPGAKGPKVAFLMYPEAETAAGRLDCLNADTFKYTITAHEVAA